MLPHRKIARAYPAGNWKLDCGVNVISDLNGHEVLRIRFTDVLHFSRGHWLAVAAQETDVH